MRSYAAILLAVMIALFAAGCSPAATTPQATATPAEATASPAPAAATPEPSTPAPTEEATPAPTDTPSAAPQLKGLILTVPVLDKNVTTDSNETNDDGTYHEGLTYDGMVGIDIDRVNGVDATEAAVKKQIESLSVVDVRDLIIKQDAALSTRLSYPAWRVTYTTGENEDTRTNVDIYIQTDGWDFRFHTATPVDAYDEYKDTVESWFAAMSLEDAQ